MAVKFYHVLAFSSANAMISNQPSYLGRTSDLVFKPTPDKTVDCDDGTTETGSEKLEISFSLLGKVVNPWPIRRLWLVPVVSDYSGAEIIKLSLESDDYRIENKSGEFEKTTFNAMLRYTVDADPWPYEFDGDYFDEYCILLGKVKTNASELVIGVTDEDDNEIVSVEAMDNTVAGYYALYLMPKGELMGITVDGDWIKTVEANDAFGVIKVDIEI